MTTPGSPRKNSPGILTAVSILIGLAVLGIVATAVLITLLATGQLA